MLQQTIELVKSQTAAEIDASGVRLYDATPGHRLVREVIELEDAIALAKAILTFAEANGSELADRAEDEERYIEWLAERFENRHDAISAHALHD